MSAPLLAPLLALLLAAPSAPAAGAVVDGRGSLQEFLLKARAQRDALLSSLKDRTDGILREIDAASVGRDLPALQSLRDRLAGVGVEATPLLLPRIEPGATANDAQKLAARTVTGALEQLAPRAFTDELVKMAQNASPDGRANVIRVLGSAPDNAPAAAALAALWKNGPVEARNAALASLARMGGALADQTLDEAFKDPRPEIVKAAVDAVVDSKSATHAPRILAIVKNPNEAGRNVDGLVRYYASVPEALGEQHVLAIVAFAMDPAPRPEDRQRLLESLAPQAKAFTSDIKKSLRKLADMPGATTRESALVLLAIGGDGKAKRDALADYEDQIQRNPDWAQSFEARAGVLYRMQEWKEARRDYEKALELSARDLRAKQDGAFIGIARCWMQEGKVKEAADTLKKAPVTPKQLAELARDPLFAPMLESAKHRDVLQPR